MSGYLGIKKGKEEMKRIMGVVVLVVVFAGVLVGGEIDNWNGWADTSSSLVCSSTVSVTGSVFQYTQDEDIRIVVQANDTSAAGFANDSISLEWGYQIGDVVLNSSNERDTLWSPKVVVDTMLIDSLGKMEAGVLSGWNETAPRRWIDTTSVSGYACQAGTFVPSWGILLRPWATGLAANNKGEPINLRWVVLRRQYSPMRRR